jgi:hypothetical protein
MINVEPLDIAYEEMPDDDFDDNAPTAKLIFPVAGTVLCHPSRVRVEADIKAVRSPVVRVEFLVDGVSIGTKTAAPFTFTWERPSVRRHTASVRVFAADGRVGTSPPVILLIID